MKRFSITHFSVKLPIAFQCVAIHSCDCLQKWCLWLHTLPLNGTDSDHLSSQIHRIDLQKSQETWMWHGCVPANHWPIIGVHCILKFPEGPKTRRLHRCSSGGGRLSAMVGFCFAWYVFLGNGRPGSQTWWKISLSKLMFINFRTT